jgi:hypothetical protein
MNTGTSFIDIGLSFVTTIRSINEWRIRRQTVAFAPGICRPLRGLENDGRIVHPAAGCYRSDAAYGGSERVYPSGSSFASIVVISATQVIEAGSGVSC